MLQPNDACKFSIDEAISIHIVTHSLKTKRLRIYYEGHLTVRKGKPDYIIRLGKDFLIMVSVTRAFHSKWDHNAKKRVDAFNYDLAHRLMTKKLMGLAHCVNYSGWFANDVYSTDGFVKPNSVRIRPIMHVLCPSFHSMKLCIAAYRDILAKNPQNADLSSIAMIVSLVRDNIYH